MKDQVEGLRAAGIRAAFLNSSLDSKSQLAVEDAFFKGELKLLYVSPEKIVSGNFIPLLQRELQQLQYAHQLRGVPFNTKWERLRHVPKLLLPLLAGSIRRAERIAFSMEARGFTSGKRTTFDKIEINSSDFVWSGVLLTLFGIAVWAGI